MASGSAQTGGGNWIGESRQVFWKLSDAARQGRERHRLTPEAALGRQGEDLAHRYLRSLGFAVIARNYKPGEDSEIDIVARDRGVLVFVEVKTRRTADYGSPDRAVDPEKMRHIQRAARSFMKRSGDSPDKIRFDVVAIVMTQPPAITHHRDVFYEGRALPIG